MAIEIQHWSLGIILWNHKISVLSIGSIYVQGRCIVFQMRLRLFVESQNQNYIIQFECKTTPWGASQVAQSNLRTD